MRVESPLADIDFSIGALRREGDRLVFESDDSSSLEATVFMSAADAGKLLAAFFKSPAAIGFALSLPFLWLRGNKRTVGAEATGNKGEHPFDQLNNPW